MGETAKQSFDDLGFKGIDANGNHQHNQWLIMGGADDNSDTLSMESSSFEDSENSLESSSSLDLTEDASSSTSPLSNGPLYELSELMAQLPIKWVNQTNHPLTIFFFLYGVFLCQVS